MKKVPKNFQVSNFSIYSGLPKTCLVVGIPTPLKNDGVSWDDHSQLFLESHNPLMFQTTSQIGLIGDDITIVRWDYKLKYANL